MSKTSYGETLSAQQLADLLQFLFHANLANEKETKERPVPICIWGPHGIGKTQSVVSFARDNKWKLAYCAPAQFEEIGDLHGLPMKVDPDPNTFGDEYTMYLPPEWVPREEGPGILMLDDINRADDRILRGLMQLLQNFEMFSWSLPPRWQIVCTANPEDGDYAVTPMDDAMMTRMIHVSMQFDVKSWAEWAVKNNIDSRGVAFVLTYPEAITGKRTTPRSLVQFFSFLKHIKDIKAELAKVIVLAKSALDDATVAAFTAFVTENLETLINPEDIYDATDWQPIEKRIRETAEGKGGSKRVDRLATICTRLFLALSQPSFVATPQRKQNVVSFLLHESIPTDLRFAVHRDISNLKEPRKRDLVQDKRLATLVLESLKR